MEKELNKLKASYEKASFQFMPDARFILRTKDEKTSIENGYWVYDKVTRSIKVCKWENREQVKPILLEFSSKTEKDGNTYFLLDEAPIALKMKKE